jgi:hypothetical protein
MMFTVGGIWPFAEFGESHLQRLLDVDVLNSSFACNGLVCFGV